MASRRSPSEGPSSSSVRAEALAEKQALLAALRQDLEAALAIMTQAAHTAREAATHEEMKPENDKDTRGIEAGYLAGAQAQRALELKRTLTELHAVTPLAFGAGDAVAATALVELVDNEGSTLRLFICPASSGQKLTHGGRITQLVSPRAPLGDALLGKRVGDVVELRTGPRVRALEVIRVS